MPGYKQDCKLGNWIPLISPERGSETKRFIFWEPSSLSKLAPEYTPITALSLGFPLPFHPVYDTLPYSVISLHNIPFL